MKSHFYLIVLFAWVMQAQAELTGFPISYSRSLGNELLLREQGPVVANVDDDDRLEIIVLSDATPNDGKSDRILVFDPDTTGSPQQIFQMPADLIASGYSFSSTPAVLDGDVDGNMEVAIGAWRDSLFNEDNCPWVSQCRHDNICLHPYSVVVIFEVGNPTVYRVNAGDALLSQPAVGDVSGDGLDDIVFAGRGAVGLGDFTSTWVWSNSIRAFSWDANAQDWEQTYQREFGVCSDAYLGFQKTVDHTTVALGDFDADGAKEIVALLPDADGLLGEAELIIMSPATNNLDTFLLTGKYVIDDTGFIGTYGGYTGPVLGDIIEDGTLDAAFFVLDELDDQTTQQLAIFNGATQQVQHYVILPNDFEVRTGDVPALANGPNTFDNRLDIYVPTRKDTLLTIQQLLWTSLSQPEFITQDFHGWPKTFEDEATWNGAFFAPTIASTILGGSLDLVSQFGVVESNNIWKIKLDENEGVDESISIGHLSNLTSPYLSCPTVADVNCDGDEELIVMVTAPDGSGRIRAFELDIETDRRNAQWNGLLNGAKHTGLYAQPVSGIQSPVNALWSGRIDVRETYTVWENMTLTIDPGTLVLFEAGQSLEVYGSLIANGTAAEPIIFAAKNPDDTWTGLSIMDGSVDMRYVNMQDFEDYGIFTDAPTSVLIDHCHLDGSDLVSNAPALLLWNAPSVTQTVRYTTIENIPNGVGFYPYNSYIKLEYDTIRNCDKVNSYIKKVSGHIHGCWFEGRTSTYAVYFNSATCNPNITCTEFKNLAPQSGSLQTTLYAAGSCSPTFAGDYGTEAYPDKTNKIEDTSLFLLTFNGTGVKPTIHINDWYQNSPTGKFMNWGGYPTPAVAFDIDRQYWNVAPTTAMFSPANAAYWDWTPVHDSPWELCSPDEGGGGGSITMPGDLAGGRGSLDDDPTDEDLLLDAMSLETSEEFEDARDAYQTLVLSATERNTRWRAMLGCITSDVKCAVSAEWIEQYLDSLEVLDGSGYQEHLDRTRFLYSHYLNQERYEDAISECTSLLLSGLTFNDSINVAVDLVGIQLSAGLIEYDGGLDGSINSLVPPPLQVFSMAEGVSRELELLAALYKPSVDAESASRASLPKTFALYQNYPNPFNPTTQIEFDLPEAVRVALKVFNTIGQEVATINDALYPAGHHVVTWNGKSNAGNDVATGLYIYQINAGTFTDTKKMLLMK